jgi:uncharacterized Zn finger protein
LLVTDDDNKLDAPKLSHDEAFRRFSTTRKAEGGIKAQSKRGKMAQTWWAARWIAVLESFQIGARLDRGKSYARKGQVMSIDVDKGVVKSSVQGSRREPYNVTIKVNQLTKAEWHKVARVFAGKAIFAAKLLAGQMPQEVESAFSEAGLTLFPAKGADLKTECSCPDWSNPCKHVAAVYYLLGEEFDRDPFLIFRLRGITRDEIMDLLDGEIAGRKPKREPQKVVALGVGADATIDAISSNHHEFWKVGELPDDILGDLKPPEAHAMLARRLGPFPFWRGETDFWQTLERIYKNAATHASRTMTP